MTKREVEIIIDGMGSSLPSRLTGNEENSIITKRLQSLVKCERKAVTELLRDWIAIRIPESKRQSGDGKKEGALFLALEIATKYSLSELRPDIEDLIADIRLGKTYLPYYEEMVSKYLECLQK